MREFTWKDARAGFVLAAGLAAFLALAGCGGGDKGGAACTGKGCVDLLNFSSTSAAIGVQGVTGTTTVPAVTAQNGVLMPGSASATVASGLGATTQFDLVENGSVARSVICTVGPDAWLDPQVNPAVVVQTNRSLTCSGW